MPRSILLPDATVDGGVDEHAARDRLLRLYEYYKLCEVRAQLTGARQDRQLAESARWELEAFGCRVWGPQYDQLLLA